MFHFIFQVVEEDEDFMEPEDGNAQGGEQENLALLADVGAQQEGQPTAGKRKRGETEGERVHTISTNYQKPAT